MTMDVTSLPPFSAEAEDAVLGSLLLDPSCIFEVQRKCKPDDMFRQKSKWIYEAIQSLHEAHQSIDELTVSEKLRDQLGSIGGTAELTRLMTGVPTSLHAQEYARTVFECAAKRKLIGAAGDIARIAYSSDDIGTVTSKVQAVLDRAMPKPDDAAHLTGDAALVDYMTTLSLRAEQLEKDPDSLLKTGWNSVDDWLIWEPGALYVVGGGAGVGKTMFMECIAEHNAMRDKHVAFYHFELSHNVMLDRRMARHSGVEYWRLRRGEMPEAVHAATQRLSEWKNNIVYIHCPGWTMGRVAGDIAALNFEWGIDLVVVDYLQKAALEEARGLNEASMVGLIVERLKNVAEVVGIPILLGSQLNRSRMSRSSPKPHVGDLRKSGETEEKANVVLLLYREMGDEDKYPSDLCEVYSEKNTFGHWGHAFLQHQPGLYRFDETDARVMSTADAVEDPWYND